MYACHVDDPGSNLGDRTKLHFKNFRNFYYPWTPLISESEMRFRKIAFPAFMLGTSLYILLPTADEIFIHPAFGLFLSYVLHIPLVYGVLLSIIIYRTVGVSCLFAALITGGKPIYYKLKESFAKNKFRKKLQEQAFRDDSPF